MKSKTTFLYGPKDLRIREIELQDLKPNQVLIKIGACGICGSDIECYEGKSTEGRYDLGPYTPGHEWSGQIVEIGSELKSNLKIGDKVVGDCVLSCGVCENCKNGNMPSACLNFREVGFRPDSPGGMGEYMILEEQYIHVIPSDWSYAEGIWAEPFSIGYFGIWGNGGYIDASDNCVIFGAGPVGISATMVSAIAGAKTIVIDPFQYRRDLALQYGADIVLDPYQNSIYDKIMEFTNGRGADVCVEASGSDQAIRSLFDISAYDGRVRLIGHSVGRNISVEIGKTIWKSLKINGSAGTKNFGPRTIRFMNRIKERFNFELLNTYIPFHMIQKGFDMAVNEKDKIMKVVLDFRM